MDADAAQAIRSRIAPLPKAELHIHLRGAMPVAVLTALLNRYPVSEALRSAPRRIRRTFERTENLRPFLIDRPWTEEEVAALFATQGFDQFLATYHFTSFFVRAPSDFRELIAGVLGSLHSERVTYAEITVSLIEYIQQGLSLRQLLDCLDEAAATAPLRVQWIVDLVRNIGPQGTMELLDRLLALGSDSVVGITLGGSEHLFPPGLFVDVYARAREGGLRRTIHAGEALGPESIWDAIRRLGVERIGHGVRAIEDPTLVEYLAEHRIPLEICPTSNLRTGIYDSYETHPLKALFEAGVPITLNTDDPTFFHTTLTEEYGHLAAMGCTLADALAIRYNGFQYAFSTDGV